jgi:DNA recombination protein Rad52
MDMEVIHKALDEKVPRDVVKTRDGGGGRSLDYLEAWYVIDRLNKVFGHTNVSWEVRTLTPVTGAKFPAYVCTARVVVKLPTGDIVFKDGVGYGIDKSGLNPHEMAVKEAESDALKRAAKNFGMSLGLALYDKTQENVADAEPAPAPVKKAKPAVKEAPAASEKDEALNKIMSLVRVADAKKAKTKQELKAYYEEKYGVKSTAELTLEQAKEFIVYLETLIK